jgi:hypothetical protein
MKRRSFLKNSTILATGATIAPGQLFVPPPNPFLLFLAELAEAIIVEVLVTTAVNFIKKEFFDDDFREKVNENNRPYTDNGMYLQPAVYQTGPLFYYPITTPQVNYYNGEMIVPFYYYESAGNNNRIIQIQKSETEQMARLATHIHKNANSPKVNNSNILLPKGEISRSFTSNRKYNTEYENQEGGRVLLERHINNNISHCTIESKSYTEKNKLIKLQTLA